MSRAELFTLITQARRSPHARRVLHDALLEEFPAYEQTLRQASNWANYFREPYFVLLDPNALQRAVNDIGLLSDAFILRHADDVRMRNRHMGLLTIGTILPDERPFDRRTWRRAPSYRQSEARRYGRLPR